MDWKWCVVRHANFNKSMAKTSNQKELVRLLYLEHGHQKASQLSGVRYDLVRKWASRYDWNVRHNVTNPVTVAANNVASEIASHETRTRLGLASHASKAISAINASVHPTKWTREAKEVAQTASIVHRWDAKSENTGNVIVNLALLGVQPHEVEATVLDVESECQGSGT